MSSNDATPRCPTCGVALTSMPKRKRTCKGCNQAILVREGRLVTEEEASVLDTVSVMADFGITRRIFDNRRSDLSARFGSRASVNDTQWSFLNELVATHAKDPITLTIVYSLMSGLVCSEDRDPLPFLLEVEKHRSRADGYKLAPGKTIFLGDSELYYVERLTERGEFERAENLLYQAEPSPAVLEALLELARAKALLAEQQQDWRAVVQALEGYKEYEQQWRRYCVKVSNQAPSQLDEDDKQMLKHAKSALKVR